MGARYPCATSRNGSLAAADAITSLRPASLAISFHPGQSPTRGARWMAQLGSTASMAGGVHPNAKNVRHPIETRIYCGFSSQEEMTACVRRRGGHRE